MNKTKTPEELAHEFIPTQQPTNPINSSQDRHALEVLFFVAGYQARDAEIEFLKQEIKELEQDLKKLEDEYL